MIINKKTTTSFQESLESIFSLQTKSSEVFKDSTQDKREEIDSTATIEGSSSTETRAIDEFGWRDAIEVGHSLGGAAATLFGGGGGSEVSGLLSSMGGAGGNSEKISDNTSTKTSNWSNNRNKTLTISNLVNSEKATNNSKDTLKKNVSNIVKKTASEVSENNKIMISSSTSEEFEEKTSEKETIKLENPNIGRTVNYNFFQLQNFFEIQTNLVDVKLVVDPGYEVIKGSNLSDVRIFELEEFGKIYPNLDKKDPRSILFAAFIARQVLNHYTNFSSSKVKASNLKILDGRTFDDDIFKILHFSDPIDENLSLNNLYSEEINEQFTVEYLAKLTKKLSSALTILKSIPFKFNTTSLLDFETVTVNSGSYYLEADVGRKSATEQYLEDRRDIEIDMQQAVVDHQKKQTEEKIFFPEIPDTVTHLNFDEKLNQQNKSIDKTEDGIAQ